MGRSIKYLLARTCSKWQILVFCIRHSPIQKELPSSQRILDGNLKEYSNQSKKDRNGRTPKCLVFYLNGLKAKINLARVMPTRRSMLFIGLELLLDLDLSSLHCSSSVSYCLSEIPEDVITKGTGSLLGGWMRTA